MIDKNLALAIHRILIDKFGGAHGIRDITLLESAVNRPLSTYDGVELYPTAIEKAACLIESIVNNHPFIDGNKRTGFFLMRFLLLKYGFKLDVSQEEKYSLVIKIAKGEYKFKEINNWINDNITFN